jgi:hypothetical protein
MLGNQVTLLLWANDWQLCVPRLQQCIWVAIKSDHHRLNAVLGRGLSQSGNKLLVSLMDSIKFSNGNRRADKSSGYLIK